MESSFRIGRVSGIEIGAHWSWLLIVALIVWSLAVAVFPETNPGLGDGTYVAMAVVAAVLFFTSLSLHELGHAIQAQRDGMEIAGITLWVFGGVAQFKGPFPSAEAELRIALAGPVVSLVIGVAFLGLSAISALPAAVDGVVSWVGYINLVLLAFNLIPALPLDGGRVLRALLWRRGGDFRQATRSAARLGRGFGQVLIGGGVALVLLVGALGGLWLAFIGWFLLAAADAELRYAEMRDAFAGMSAADVMVSDPVTVDPEQPLDRFMEEIFFPHRFIAYPVVEDGRPVGLISFRSVAGLPDEERRSGRVRDRMSPLDEVPSFEPGAALGEAVQRLAESPLRRGVVVETGRLVGLLSWTDASRLLEAERDQP